MTGSPADRAGSADLRGAGSGWGPLVHAIREEVPDGFPPWRDNAYIAFWDLDQSICGTLHVSTSPNQAGGRARFSLSMEGRVIEVIEPLAPGTFTSVSISFDGGASFSVSTDRMSMSINTAPRLALADYNGDHTPTALGLAGPEPLRHYQRGAQVSGQLVIDGEERVIDGLGFRDRTWGYRDEASSMIEYFGYMFTLDDAHVTVIKTLAPDGTSETVGFLLEEAATPVTDVSLVRDASGLFASTSITLADGRVMQLRRAGLIGAFWCPLGEERTGPTMSAYDEFLTFTGPADGVGVVEHGSLRQLF